MQATFSPQFCFLLAQEMGPSQQCSVHAAKRSNQPSTKGTIADVLFGIMPVSTTFSGPPVRDASFARCFGLILSTIRSTKSQWKNRGPWHTTPFREYDTGGGLSYPDLESQCELKSVYPTMRLRLQMRGDRKEMSFQGVQAWSWT